MQRWLRLTILLVLPLTASATTNAQSVTGGLIGYWPFNGNGSDLSGGARSLTIYGNAGFAGGLFGQALDLHANQSQYAGRPVDDSVFDFGLSNFTVQIWVNYNTVQREQNLFEKFEGGGGPGWTLTSLLEGAGSTFGQAHFWAIEGQLALYSQAPLNFKTGVWRHFVARRTGTSFELFNNGVVVDSKTNALPVTNTAFPLIVGRRNAADGRDFSADGRLDEAAIWNRTLTNSEIAFLYNGGAGNPVIVPEPRCAAIVAIIACVGVCGRRRLTSPRHR